jgi:hypothetical protein
MGSFAETMTLRLGLMLTAVALTATAWGQGNAQQRTSEQHERRITEPEAQMKNNDLERLRSRDPQAVMAQVNEDFQRLKALNAEVGRHARTEGPCAGGGGGQETRPPA